jgi:guanylate kinase
MLRKDFPNDFGFSVSHTTRKPRGGEAHGVDYFFSTKEEMEKEIAAGLFLEHAAVHSNIYGTSKKAVQAVQDKALVCILDIDVQGVRNIMNNASELDSYYVFIAPPNIQELEKRLRHRGTESEESLKVRLANAEGEMKAAKEMPFDKYIVNDNIDKSYAELKGAIEDKRCDCAKYRGLVAGKAT